MTISAPADLSGYGLRAGSSQVMGAFRVVPILRASAPGDLRIGIRDYSAYGLVGVDGRPHAPGIKYLSYIPHGFVIAHTADGSEATLGASLGEKKPCCVKLHHRMVKREADTDGPTRRFRMLPLHLAMEGFLALHFRGPEILWSDYSEQAARRGLSPRMETSMHGAWIRGFEDALRVFEIHETQVGVMVFIAEALASVFVVSHPDDYRRLHLSLLEDFYGELLYNYAMLYPQKPLAFAHLDQSKVATLDDLEREADRVRGAHRDYTDLLAEGLFGRPMVTERLRTMGPFELDRFTPVFDPNEECHIGERILRKDGTLEYMKTFRLSSAQVRRAYLLSKIAEAEWNLDVAAKALACTYDELVKRLVNAGFGSLVKLHIAKAAMRPF